MKLNAILAALRMTVLRRTMKKEKRCHRDRECATPQTRFAAPDHTHRSRVLRVLRVLANYTQRHEKLQPISPASRAIKIAHTATAKSCRGKTFPRLANSSCIAAASSKFARECIFCTREIVSVSRRLLCRREEAFDRRSML
jgi:hypothetical protein